MSITIPTGTVLCNTPEQISAWEVGILTKIRVETYISHKASLVALITGLSQCALKDDAGTWHIETTKRHMAVLTGLSPSAVWRGLKWLEEEGLLFSEHKASMRSRCERSRYYPLLPAGTNPRDLLKNCSVGIPRSFLPVALHSKSNGASWTERETAPVTSLNDPRHNTWHGHRTAWLVYVTMAQNWALPMSPQELRQETGLSFHALRDELTWLQAEGLIEWVDTDGPWDRRLLNVIYTTAAEDLARDQAVPNYRAERYARIQVERELHRKWIEAGAKSKHELLPQIQRCYRLFRERIHARTMTVGLAP